MWAYVTAQKLIQGGAEVVFSAGGLTGQGALQAACEAGIPAIGAERDQAQALS
jgi:basic membrane lipoprotein Med (substrate-binding protein (PBP1-ABC) superfamily)